MTSPAADHGPTHGRGFLANLTVTCVLFALSYTTSCVQRERQADELKQQGRELQEIKAMMAERRGRNE